MVSGDTSRHTGDSSVDGSKGVPADSRCDIMALELRPATEERMPSKMADPTAVASVRRSSVHSTAANSAVRRSAVPTPSNTKQHQATPSNTKQRKVSTLGMPKGTGTASSVAPSEMPHCAEASLRPCWSSASARSR